MAEVAAVVNVHLSSLAHCFIVATSFVAQGVSFMESTSSQRHCSSVGCLLRDRAFRACLLLRSHLVLPSRGAVPEKETFKDTGTL